MRYDRSDSPRGMALVLVLATLVIAVTVAAGVARLAALNSLHAKQAVSTRLSDALFLETEMPIRHWLEEESELVVLSDTVESPMVLILHDHLRIDQQTSIELRITAWDQLGMVPWTAARRGSIIRLAIPNDIRQTIDQITDDEINRTNPGLDIFLRNKHGRTPIFPITATNTSDELIIFNTAQSSLLQSALSTESNVLPSTIRATKNTLAVGEVIATHNHYTPPRLNINTAPLPLIEAAYRSVGRGGSDVIRQQRSKGKMASLRTAPANSERSSDITFTNSSDIWSFRVDITVNDMTQSWWLIYQRNNRTRNRIDDSPWRCVQRLLIMEEMN